MSLDEAEVSDSSGKERESSDEQTCPFCGGPLLEIHCISRCARCHVIVDTCCEGLRMPRISAGSSRDKPNGKKQVPDQDQVEGA